MSNLLDTPKLGFGCMRLPLTDPKDQKSIDIEHLKKMVDAFIEAGGTYFDTAYVYHEANQKLLCARRWWSAIRAIRLPSLPSA